MMANSSHRQRLRRNQNTVSRMLSLYAPILSCGREMFVAEAL